MSLLVPLGLVALVALPIVVLLHMRHTTPRQRPIPSLRFWLAAEPRRTEQTRFRRPPLTLLLLLQLLIAGALAVALARPATGRALDLFGLDLRTEPRHLLLLVDGSTSMAATDTPAGISRFEAARRATLDRLATLREGDVATVLLLGTRTTSFGATDAASLRALRERVAAVPQPGGRADLDAALTLARDLLIPGLDDEVTLLTDGAVAVDPGVVARLGAPVELLLVGAAATGAPADNVAVVDLSTRAAPDNPDLRQLYARVVNFGATSVAVPIALTGDGLELGRETATLPADGGAVELSWALPEGTGEVEVRAESDDALPADDRASLVLPGGEGEADELALDVLLLSDAPTPLQRALAALPGARVTTEPVDAVGDALAGRPFDLVVYERSLPPLDAPAAAAIPMLFVNPPAGGPFLTDGALLEPTVSRLRADDPLLVGVDLAGATFGETPRYVLGDGQAEVVGAAEGPLVFRGEVEGQPAIVLAFDLAQSNLPRRVAFPILIANAVAELAPSPLPPSVPLGDPLEYRPRAGAATIRIAPPGGEPVDLSLAVAPTSTRVEGAEGPDGAAPERLRTVVFADTGEPGVYRVRELDDRGQERGGGSFTVNAGHPRESDLRPNPDLAPALAAAAGSSDAPGGAALSDLWPALALLALVALAVEWLVAVTRRPRGPGPTRLAPRSTG